MSATSSSRTSVPASESRPPSWAVRIGGWGCCIGDLSEATAAVSPPDRMTSAAGGHCSTPRDANIRALSDSFGFPCKPTHLYPVDDPAAAPGSHPSATGAHHGRNLTERQPGAFDSVDLPSTKNPQRADNPSADRRRVAHRRSTSDGPRRRWRAEPRTARRVWTRAIVVARSLSGCLTDESPAPHSGRGRTFEGSGG